MLGDPVDLVDPEGKNPLILIALWVIGLSEYANSPTVGEKAQSGPTEAAMVLPLNPLAKPAKEVCQTFNYTQKVLNQMDTDIYH